MDNIPEQDAVKVIPALINSKTSNIILVKITDEEYHSNPRVSAHNSQTLLRKPLSVLRERAETPALKFGTAFHFFSLECGGSEAEFLKHYSAIPEFSGTGSRKAKQEWLEQNSDKKTIDNDDFSLIQTMFNRFTEAGTRSAKVFNRKGEVFNEIACFWDYYNEDGTITECKAKFDRLILDEETGEVFIIDLKTTADASPEQFAKDSANFAYGWQSAFYSLPFAENGMIPHFYIIAVEKEEIGGAVGVYNMVKFTGIEIENVEKFIENFHRISEEQNFKQYGETSIILEPPAWFTGTKVNI